MTRKNKKTNKKTNTNTLKLSLEDITLGLVYGTLEVKVEDIDRPSPIMDVQWEDCLKLVAGIEGRPTKTYIKAMAKAIAAKLFEDAMAMATTDAFEQGIYASALLLLGKAKSKAQADEMENAASDKVFNHEMSFDGMEAEVIVLDLADAIEERVYKALLETIDAKE